MDLTVEVKEEPVWLEGAASPSFDNYKLVSEEMHLKPEVAETGITQANTFEPLAEVKNEIFQEEHTVGQLAPCLKEEDNVQNVAELTSGPVDTCPSSCKVLKTRSELMCAVPADNASDQHLLSQCGERPLHHTECNTTLSLKSYDVRLTSNSRERLHVCDECGKTIFFKSPLQCHFLSQTGKQLNFCDECVKRFCKVADVGQQSRIRQLCCYKCGKSYSSRSSLNRHMLSHTGERPHCCNECGRTFTEMSRLNAHMLSHTRERTQHICTECGRSYSFKGDLLKHLRTHTGENPHCCEECGKTFSMTKGLIQHMLTHTGEWSHCCTDCGKTFKTKGGLTKHALSHTGERPYCCNACGRRFVQKSSLRTHMLTHTGERPHCCIQCGKSFAAKGSLTRHLLIHNV